MSGSQNVFEFGPDEKIGCYSWPHDSKLFVFDRDTEIRDMVLIRNSD